MYLPAPEQNIVCRGQEPGSLEGYHDLKATMQQKTKDEESPTGCPFENPVGVCALSPLDDEDAGCGFTLLVWIDSEMKSLGGIISTISIVPIIGSLFACCMCFKRKHADVLPTKYVQTMGQ